MNENDIPEDVMKAASFANMKARVTSGIEQQNRTIARAILAERERCAKVAEEYSDGHYKCTGFLIAAAIRNPTASA